jgi:hypothetical protein
MFMSLGNSAGIGTGRPEFDSRQEQESVQTGSEVHTVSCPVDIKVSFFQVFKRPELEAHLSSI